MGGPEVLSARCLTTLVLLWQFISDLSASSFRFVFEEGPQDALHQQVALVMDGTSELELESSSIPDVHISGGVGYLWDADGVRLLRLKHRLVGSMVGSLPGFVQQDLVRGLPLRLSKEEVSLAVSQGWVRLLKEKYDHSSVTPVVEGPTETASSAPGVAASPPAASEAGAPAGKKVYYKAPKKKKKKFERNCSAEASSAEGSSASANPTCPIEKAVSAHTITLKVAAGSPKGSHSAIPFDLSSGEWEGSLNRDEQRRSLVFSDLHRRGYTMTGGTKFGADFLAYPGDPTAYHAQFAVRVCTPDATLNPWALTAAVRTEHTARKHLLLAYIAEETDTSRNGEVQYISVAPDVLQSSNKRRFAEA
ncbi:hypothetical protein CYMTET_26715 [Cymbomonas tetramitiformis]|uniref:tRNA-intron lyase n=1 Tax=Cymbomonas tetramitiformis TaxID=36881 RepID=A0AAE0FR87_9CHLO|nr:hypothetical protein CYMTET_26715 [Cymbomonas tetramitiformis]